MVIFEVAEVPPEAHQGAREARQRRHFEFEKNFESINPPQTNHP
jgi:hypothetical protein